uniref:Uncharacterized protein n=1 Tax=Medicago truncatula TaxID=3880 RepID=I3T8H0_MEDTR|nr:unknown [Medicago truncatula]
MMVPAQVKLLEKIVKLLYTHKPFSRIHSEGVTISWLCVMHTLQLENPFPPTRDTQLPRFSAILMLLLKYHGMVLNKNTPCCRKTSTGLLVGQLVVFLDLRDHTIVVLVLTKHLAVTLLTHITKPVFMPASTSVESMVK